MNIRSYLTPCKYGRPVLVGSGEPGSFDRHAVDCPFVFRHLDRFYMMYVGFDGLGYQTALATSGDLLHWEPLATILDREDGSRWDSRNIAGTWMLRENNLHGAPTLKKWQGKYWLTYHSYPGDGYEAGPAKIGLAWTEDENLLTWHRLEEPILVPEEGAEWERGGLYKECLVEHEGTFYLFYNAKNQDHGRWIEQTGVALSTDLRSWKRYEHNPVLQVTPGAWDSGFVSDPCVLRDGDRWVMYFFGYDYKKAQEGIALSDDLLHWDKHPEPIIETGTEGELDAIFAHKPSVICHNGILYHFYTASRRPQDGDRTCNIFPEFRTITVATSEPLSPKTTMNALQIESMWTEGRNCPLGLDATAPMLGWSFSQSKTHSRLQTAYRIAVATTEELLASDQPDVWDSGRRIGGNHAAIPCEGAGLEARRRYYWQVTVWDEQGRQTMSPVSWWETGLLRAENWSGQWIGAAQGKADDGPLPRFRRSFRIGKPIRRARAYISGLGHYELRLNGAKVGDYELDPGWTEYDKTVLYTVYDITDALSQGENVAGITLGNGFYHVMGGRYTKFKDSYGAPKCLAELIIDYADGTTETIGTDRSWRTAASPLVFSCIYGGEDYDAQRELNDWDRPGYEEGSEWNSAAEVKAPSGKMAAQSAPALKVMEQLSPVSVTEPKPGVFVVDLGRNFSGWTEIAVSGPRGAAIKLTPAELLTGDGLANQKWSGSPYEWNYVLKGDGEERWRPKFTYYGFRYVQVEGVGAIRSESDAAGADGLPVLHRVEGQMIYPDVRTTGSFRCSDELLNRIHDIIGRAMLSNMKSVLTDCPHREKLGWLEQVHLMGPSMMFNYDVEALLMKVLSDIADAQQPNGLIPTTAPEYVVFPEPWEVFRDAAAWGGACVLASWELLQRYGNAGAMSRHYGTLGRYLDYLTATADGRILRAGLGDWYDVGPKGPGFSQNTPVALAETAIYYGLAVVMRVIARRLGREDDAAAYGRLAEEIKVAFNREFFDEAASSYAEGSDAALAMPLAIGLAPEAHREALFARLVRNIEERGDRTTSGDVGHRYVLLTLARGGRSDLVYRMTRRSDTPGYGYQIANGATTLTEAWDGPTVGKSQNHFMLGHLEEWLYTGLAGLDYRYVPDTGRFSVQAKPGVVGDVQWAEARFELRAGVASIRWDRGEDRKLQVAVVIPPNAEGTVHLPAKDTDSVAVEGEGARFVGYEEGCAVYRTGPGTFTFTRSEAI